MKIFYSLVFLFVFFLPPANAAGEAEPSALRFTENKGQWDDFIRFRADLGYGSLFLEEGRLTYFLMDPQVHFGHGHKMDTLVQCHAFRIHFVNASGSARYEGREKDSAFKNYFLGNNPSRWATRVNSFQKVALRQIYPGVDFRIYGSGSNIKYDFVARPGADVSAIGLEYEGVDKIFLRNGRLHIVTSVAEIIEQAPVAYQMIGERRIPVECDFVLDGKKVGFHFPQGYDDRYELIIDPTLVFASYSGSMADNWGFSATYDDYGNLYGGGIAFDQGYPVTTGAFQVNFAEKIDISISKFDATGSNLIYSTYLGGSQTELPHSLIVNSVGQLIVLGSTGSDDYPITSNAFDKSFNGGMPQITSSGLVYSDGADIILSIFDITGGALVASTYVGGSDNDGVNFVKYQMNYGDDARGEVYTDAFNNIYVGTVTSSEDFPVTPGAFQTQYGGGLKDGVVFKMSFDLSAMLWASYLGGSEEDAAFSMKLDSKGNVFAAGFTQSNDFPTSFNAPHPNYLGGASDGFVVRMNPAGNQLTGATYLGTDGADRAYFLDFDVYDNVLVTGQTDGAYPVTQGVYSNPGSSQFIQKLNNDLTQMGFSTVIGNGKGDRELSPAAFMVDVCNKIYFSGWGGKVNDGTVKNISGMPVTPDAFQSTTDGSDFYFIVLDEEAAGLVYASYFGGPTSREHVDGGTSRFDKKGTIYQAVCAGCGGHDDFPTTPGAVSNTNNSYNCNIGVIKLDFEPPVVIAGALPTPAFSGCVPFTVHFSNFSTGAVSYLWDFGDGTTGTDANPSHTYTTPGNYTVMLIATNGATTCNVTDTAFIPIAVLDNNQSVQTDIEICQGEKVLLTPSFGVPGAQYLWQDGSTQFAVFADEPQTYWVQTSIGGCTYVDTFHVAVSPFGGSHFEDLHSCQGDSLVLYPSLASPDDKYVWSDGSTADSLTVTQEGLYRVEGYSGNCVRRDSFLVSFHPVYDQTTSVTICEGDSLFFDGSFLTTDTLTMAKLATLYGCDSVVTLELSLHPLFRDTSEVLFCRGERFVLPDGTAVAEEGEFVSKFVDAFGCDSIRVTRLAYFPETDYLYLTEDTVQVELGYPANLHAMTSFDTIQWSPAGQVDCPFCPNVTVMPYTDTWFYVDAVDDFGCSREDSVLVRVLRTQSVYIPNAFSPNGDGINDFFSVFADRGVKQINYLRVYDRWGNMIYQGEGLAPNQERTGWDGRFRGKLMDPAVFIYVAEVEFLNGERVIYSGDVTLIR